MTGRALAVAALAVAAAGLSACGSSSSSGGSMNDAGSYGGSTSRDAAAGGTNGAGGFGTGSGGSGTGSGGSGGSATTGSGGGTGAGGAAGSLDAGIGDGGGTGGSPMPCKVVINPVSPVDLDDVLPAGPNQVLRVRGVLTGDVLPTQLAWTWTVTIATNSESVPVTVPDPQDPSVIEFPIAKQGNYLIAVTVSNAPACSGSRTVTTTTTPRVFYWVRVLPPVGLVNPPAALTNLAPWEDFIAVDAGKMLARTLSFSHAIRVTINPMDANQNGVESYVLITSPKQSWSSEGDTLPPFMTPLIDAPGTLYDVLVAPIGTNGMPAAYAPVFFPGKTAAAVGGLPLTLQPGVQVSGNLTLQGGGAVIGASVVLRAGALPSTIGRSVSGGAYSLLAREGRVSAVIVPPDSALLPEAHVDADASAGIDLPAPQTVPVTLGFSWRNDLAAGTLSARFVTGSGGPAAAMDVQLDSDPGSLPNVGTLQVAGSAAGSASFTATGVVHRTGTTDATGAVSFAGLSRATYHLVAIPPVSSADGITSTAVDLTAGPPASPVIVNLAPKVVVSGTLGKAPAGTRIITLDDQPTLGHVFPAVAVGGGGAFSVSLDPLHAYHLLVDPPAGQKASRVAIGPVLTGTSPPLPSTLTFPNMLPFTGLVRAPDGTTAVAGAHVQVFCTGLGPDCIDTSQLGSKDPLPLIEGVTDMTGAFSLWVPDPALPSP